MNNENMKIGGRGFISILELVVVSMVLVTAFAVMFPTVTYKSNWDNALLLLRGRDIVLTADALGKTYDYSFDTAEFGTFLDNIFEGTNFVTFSGTQDAVKPEVKIACACNDSQIEALGSWLDNVKINGRDIDFIIYKSNLASITPSDILVIWGYTDLSSYRSSIESYLSAGSGVVEIMDFTSSVGSVQQEIFGIANGGGWGNDVDYVVKPGSGTSLTYQTYKLFYHLPFTLEADEYATATAKCSQSNRTGVFKMRGLERRFWICNASSVYIDTDGNGNEDTGALLQNSTFTIDGYKLKVSHIYSESKAGIDFENTPEYKFVDFIRTPSIDKIAPSDGDYTRSLVCRENPLPQKSCGVILNNASGWRTAWIADFTRTSLDVDDDLKLVFESLLLWTSNKESTSAAVSLSKGYVIPFVNVKDTDVFEVYKFNFGIGYPY